jgi:hypothetical protein
MKAFSPLAFTALLAFFSVLRVFRGRKAFPLGASRNAATANLPAERKIKEWFLPPFPYPFSYGTFSSSGTPRNHRLCNSILAPLPSTLPIAE